MKVIKNIHPRLLKEKNKTTHTKNNTHTHKEVHQKHDPKCSCVYKTIYQTRQSSHCNVLTTCLYRTEGVLNKLRAAMQSNIHYFLEKTIASTGHHSHFRFLCSIQEWMQQRFHQKFVIYTTVVMSGNENFTFVKIWSLHLIY